MGKTSTDCRCITERISPFDGEKASESSRFGQSVRVHPTLSAAERDVS
jgi:hypothetical protein